MANPHRIPSWPRSWPRSGSARRNLFGPVDREQLQTECQAALRKDLEEASRRWSFDFASDKPLESDDFKWEGVPAAKVPLPYRSCAVGVRRPETQKAREPSVQPKGRRVGPPKSEKENIPEHPTEKCCFANMEKTPVKRENGGIKRKQTNITDFYQAKRRVVGMPLKSGE